SIGDLASVLLFASIGSWAAIKFVTMWPVNQPPLPFKWPLLIRDGIVIVIGCFLYAALWVWHGELFGVGLGNAYAF
ncbi:MAG: hypothetical protein RL120_02710, partial [Gammaproteobacteria bacterium]